MKEAKFYRKTDSNNLKCTLCPHECSIKNGQYGLCKVRKNIEGKLYSLNYAKISALAMDPVEKKPLYHYYPGSNILSVGTYGCNFKCSFCQNWQISQNKPPLKDIRPEELVEIAKNRNSIGIAYTYSEPSVWYEFVYETAKLARKRNLKNVLITNGFINKKALVDLLPYIDAVNVDLKAFNDEFYHEQAVGQLQPVLDNIKYIYDNF